MSGRDKKLDVLRLVEPTGDAWIIGVEAEGDEGEFVRFRLNSLFSDQVADISEMEVRKGDGEEYRPLREWLDLGGSDGGGAVSWTDILGKPTTFQPSAHSHAWDEITGKPTLFDGTWSSLTGKPATFTPSTHTHLWADITDKPVLFSGSYTDLTNKPTLFDGTWNSLSGKPLTFAPSAHSHSLADLPVAASGASSATQLVRADDSRLSDARAPTAHSHVLADLPVAASGTSSATQLVRADDSRLSNARAPTAHSHALADLPVAASGTSSATQLVRADDSRLSNARAPTAHTHPVSEITGLAGAWTAYTPTLTPASGSFATVSAAGQYLQVAALGICYVSITITITSIGTASGNLTASLPIAAMNAIDKQFSGREDGLTGKMLNGPLSGGALLIQNYDGTSPMASGAILRIAGWYRI